MGHLKSIARLLTLPCDEVARLVSESLDRPLPLPERAALRLHLVYCVACRRYRRQALFLRRVFDRLTPWSDHAATVGLPPLPPEVRERIKRALREI